MVITFYQKDATLSILFSRISVNLIEGPRLNLQKSRSNVFFAMGVALHIITCPPSPSKGKAFSVVRGVGWYISAMEIPPAGAPLGAGFDCAAMVGGCA